MGEARLPHNLQGLLRFCMQVGDNPQVSPDLANGMDPERARWLREAMDSLTVDIGKRLRDNIAKLLQNADSAAEDPNSEAYTACQDCLEETSDLCDNLDIANDFVKLGGLDAAAYVCQRCGGQLRAMSLQLLARLFQNNPFAQAAGLGCLADLVRAIRDPANDPDSLDVKFAALSALSCLTRDCSAAQAACATAGGFSAIAECIRVNADDTNKEIIRRQYRLRRKAAFLLASLAGESDLLAEALADDQGGVVVVALTDSILEFDNDISDIIDTDGEKLDWLEHALRCLLLLRQRRPNLLDDVGRSGRLATRLESLLLQCPAPRQSAESADLTEIAELAGQLIRPASDAATADCANADR